MYLLIPIAHSNAAVPNAGDAAMGAVNIHGELCKLLTYPGAPGGDEVQQAAVGCACSLCCHPLLALRICQDPEAVRLCASRQATHDAALAHNPSPLLKGTSQGDPAFLYWEGLSV